MNSMIAFLIAAVPSGIAWMLGRFLSRRAFGLRHAPWMLLACAGVWIGYQANQQDSGSTMGSGFEAAAWLMFGILLMVSGLVAGVLMLFFPGTARRRTGPDPASGHAVRPRVVAETFAVLRQALEPELPTELLIKAVRPVSALQEADCRGIPNRAGILFRGLTASDAEKIRKELIARDFPVRVLPESRLFKLPMGRRVAGLRLEMDALVETDCVGREIRHPLKKIVQYRGGRIEDLVYREQTQTKTRVVHDMSGHARKETYQEKKRGLEPMASLRIDLLVSSDPHRIIWTCDQTQRRVLQGKPVGPEDNGAFDSFLNLMRKQMLQTRSQGKNLTGNDSSSRVYPSLRAFEDEIIWEQTCLIS